MKVQCRIPYALTDYFVKNLEKIPSALEFQSKQPECENRKFYQVIELSSIIFA
jgi:hypothetical protein